MIKINYPKDIEDKYYEIIASRKMSKYKYITFEGYYNKYIKNKLSRYSLKDIVCGDFEELLKIKNKIGTKYSSQTNIIKQFFNYDKNNKKIKTSKFQPNISKFVEKHIELDICYYCNIDFINKFKNHKDEIKNAFTLDHVIDKATYPYLALSLYNLVPSCYVCNSKVKGKNEIKDLSPTDKNFDFEKTVKFKTFMLNDNLQIENEKDFELFLKEDFSSIYDKYIEVLELDNRYKYHKDKVIEMINKRKDYPDSRIKELSQLTQKTQQEIKHDLFGKYTDNLSKKPLSKLIKDISEELGLI